MGRFLQKGGGAFPPGWGVDEPGTDTVDIDVVSLANSLASDQVKVIMAPFIVL
ncbi:MAG: hypothetical protein QGG49_01400 [Dehalococcoidales bacterium]|nr:hypothetical protein [Dehalococcoidales bacterium]